MPGVRAQPEPAWRVIAPAPIAPRGFHTAVWTGEEMIVWGGASRGKLFSDGAAYDPIANIWRALAPSPLEGRTAHAAIWTGTEMIVWGGCCERGGDEYADGAAYDPATDTWRELPPAPLEGRTEHEAVWSRHKMIIWGGHVFDETYSDGATYNPKNDRWRLIAPAPIAGRYAHTATVAGRRVILWGGADAEGALGDGAWYEPAEDRWGTIAEAPLLARAGHTATQAGPTTAVVAGCCDAEGLEFSDAAVYNAVLDEWEIFPTRRLEPRQAHTALWVDGPGLVVWGGRNGIEHYLADGRIYAASVSTIGPEYPLTLAPGLSAAIPPSPLAPRAGHTALEIEEGMLVWGGCCDAHQRPFDDGAVLSRAVLGDLARRSAVRGVGGDLDLSLGPEDRDFGIGAMIFFIALVLVVGLFVLARAVWRRERAED